MPSEIDPMKAREYLIKRVQHDFTYKANFTEEQTEMWNDVKAIFDEFRSDVATLFLMMPDGQDIMDKAEEYLAYKFALREAERQVNSAIANDWDKGTPIPHKDTMPILYDGPSGGKELRHKICDGISKISYELACSVASFAPQGRHLSIALTRLEDVRGWLLDAVNHHCPKTLPNVSGGVNMAEIAAATG